MPSLTEAIERKYSAENHTVNIDPNPDFVILVPKTTALDCVPTSLVLDKCNVDSAGETDELQRLCGKALELDLSHNDLTNWSEIEKILKHSPLVKFVNLSFNNLSKEIEDHEFQETFSSLQSLVLIGTNIQWKSVWKILTVANNLQELHLSLNSFKTVELLNEEQKFPSIKKFVFDGNFVNDWENIAKFGKIFPNLMQLSVSSNTSLRLCGSAHDSFKNLEIINVSDTGIESHEEIHKLNDFPVLKEVRISGIPLLKECPEKEKRQEIIALLPKIKKLNGGAEISLEERDGSERYFIRKYLDSDAKPVRYEELIQKHGKLDPLVEINLKPAKKVTLKIKFGNMEMEKIINLYQSVRDLKKLLEAEIGVQASRMQLYHLDMEINFGREVLRFQDKQLYTYKMHDGDEIHVELKNNTAREINQS